MKLFLDTTNKKYIIALIVNGIVASFEMKDTKNRVAKNANIWMNDFLKKNKVSIDDIKDFYVTKGPGSFTGVKVGFNIISTIAMVKGIKTVYTIDTLDLIRDNDKSAAALSFGKGKYYYRKYNTIFMNGFPIQWTLSSFTKSFQVKTKLPETKVGKFFTRNEVELDYENFTKEKLEAKLPKFKQELIKKVELVFPKLNY